MSNEVIKFGKNLKKERLKKGLSQGDVARILGVHRTYVSGLEREARNPSLLTIQKVALALGSSRTWCKSKKFGRITNMRQKLFSLVFLATLVLGTFPIQNARALSCAQTFPIVGIVGSISVKESYTEIVLDKFYTFNNSDWNVNNTISIDRYENIVKEYVRNNFQLSEKPSSEYSERLNTVSVPTSAFNQTQIKEWRHNHKWTSIPCLQFSVYRII